MVRKFVIQGELVSILDETLIQQVALADVMPFIETRIPIVTPVLPANNVRAMRYSEEQLQKTLELLVSLDPGVRTLPYTDAPEGHIRVALPYIVFHFILTTGATNPQGRDWAFDTYRIFFARERINDLDQKVIPATLPNVYNDGRICLGDTGVNTRQPLADRIDQFVNEFLISTFTNHHVRDYPWPWEAEVMANGGHDLGYQVWEQKTRQSPTCWRDFPEWDENDGHQTHYALKDLFAAGIRQTDPITVTDAIPVLPLVPTFGGAEEWATTQLTNFQRIRLHAALENIAADHPEYFVPTEVPA